MRAEGNTPGQFADLNRFDDLLARHVDDGDVVRDAIGDQQIFLIRRKSAVPDSLAYQQIFQDGVRDAVDHRHPIGRPGIDEAEVALLGYVDADRLYAIGSNPLKLEGLRLLELPSYRSDGPTAPAH